MRAFITPSTENYEVFASVSHPQGGPAGKGGRVGANHASRPASARGGASPGGGAGRAGERASGNPASRWALALGLIGGLAFGGAGCGDVSNDADADAGGENGENGGEGGNGENGGGGGNGDAGASPAPDAGGDCDPGFTGPDCAICTVFVDGEAGADSDTGLDWDEALATVNVGIGRAASRYDDGDVDHCEVWVREGAYVPGDDPRDSIELEPGVHVYGGFTGVEDAREDRDFEEHETILSGDLAGDGDPEGNAHHVLVGASGAILDGFTITAGNAHEDGEFIDRQGGGMLNAGGSAPTLKNVTFEGNRAEGSGGAMYNRDDSAPVLVNVAFRDNEARVNGGAIFNGDRSAPTLKNVAFAENTAHGDGSLDAGRGGAVYSLNDSAPTLKNATFAANEARHIGGAVHSASSSDIDIVNAILWANDAGGGDTDEISHTSDEPLAIGHSIVEGGTSHLDDVNETGPVLGESEGDDPLFESAPNDLRVQAGSPAIDAGDSSVAEASGFPETDLAGAPRLVDGTGNGQAEIDMGAFEYQPD